MPLTKVAVKSELRGIMATTNVELTYVNPSKDDPLECTYTFPLDKTSVLAKFEASIDNRIIVTKIKDKESAKEQYDDAVASGNTAVIAERKKKDEVMTVKLGNLMPGQSATLKSTILSQLEVIGGNYSYSLPAAFFPDYKKHGVKEKAAYTYEFAYEVKIIAECPISNLSIPGNAIIMAQNEARTEI